MSEGRTFSKGMKAGIPIGLGYFAVAFSLGVTAHDCGFNAFQGFLSSFTTYASAGQYMGFTMYAANVTLLQYIAIIAITNARYLLMGVALNQKLPAGTSPAKRLMLGATITDEIFGISIAQPGGLNPEYPLGALIVAMPLWSFGTALGITMGNLLPLRAVSALSVCLYGMFLAVIIPPSRKDKTVGIFVAISFAASFASKYISRVRNITEGRSSLHVDPPKKPADSFRPLVHPPRSREPAGPRRPQQTSGSGIRLSPPYPAATASAEPR